ncbi:heme-binding protein [Bradyrhizobium yuanmingense]|nr:heme-binding protein [Bradyrhizobium yuanmingense]MDF0584695.1 heme-binding protein [Bradyrhizobium yuanmingense]
MTLRDRLVGYLPRYAGLASRFAPLAIGATAARCCGSCSSALPSSAHAGRSPGALAMGMGSRALFQRAQEQAYLIHAVNTIAKGALVPVPGGVLIMDGATLLGAVGVSGDTSDNDEACVVAGIQAAGLKANAG